MHKLEIENRRRDRGVGIVELVIVLAIVGIVSTVALL